MMVTHTHLQKFWPGSVMRVDEDLDGGSDGARLDPLVVFLGLGHRAQEVGRAPDGLALVLDEDLVHADLLGQEAALPAGGGQLEVGVDGAGGPDDLGGDGPLVEPVALQDVDLEGALLADAHLGGGAADLERLGGRRLPLDPLELRRPRHHAQVLDVGRGHVARLHHGLHAQLPTALDGGVQVGQPPVRVVLHLVVAGDGAALGLDQRRRRQAVVPVRPEVVDPLVRDLLLDPVEGGVVTGAVLLLLIDKIQMNITSLLMSSLNQYYIPS